MINPREVGPVEVLSRVFAWFDEHALKIALVGLSGAVVFGVGVERGWFPVPTIPTAFWVVFWGVVGGGVLAAYPMWRLIQTLWDDEAVRLVELDPRSGDLSVWALTEERFSRLTVLDHQAREQDPSTFLNDLRLGSGELAYEIDAYDPEENVAVASWMAGVRNREIRRHERALDYIKKQLSVEADKTLDQLINSNDVLRQQGKAVGMHLIKTVEGVQTPDSGETQLYDQMFDALNDNDRTDDLISDSGADDPEDAIRAFVEEQEPDDENDEDDNDGAEVEPARSDQSLAIELTRNGNDSGGGDS